MSQTESFDDSNAITLIATGPGVSSRVLRLGEVIGGSYKLKSLLGKGGMGYVFCAEHTIIQCDYALKIVAPEQLNEDSRRRFETEGRAIANLDHPNIVKVYNMGLDAGDCPYYVMDLLDGRALSDFISARQDIALEECLDIFGQIASGLGYAHSKGIVHRDVKPSNVILLQDNKGRRQVKIVDFGIAKLLPSASLHSQSQTATGEVFGSPLYMSPEQCMGTAVDHRSDIYSLGCTFYEALCGQPPYRGQNAMETVMMHQNKPTPSILQARPDKHLPQSVDLLLTKMMAKRPEDRYQSMDQLIHDLERVKQGKAIGKASAGSPANSSQANQAPAPSRGGVDEAEAPEGNLNQRGHGQPRPLLLTLGLVTVLALIGAIYAWYAYPELFRTRQNGPASQTSQPGQKLTAESAGSAPSNKPMPESHDKVLGADVSLTEVFAHGHLKAFSDRDLKEAHDKFADAASIKSTFATIGGIRKRTIVFPDWPIGKISIAPPDPLAVCRKNLSTRHDWKISPAVFERIACGSVELPVNQPLLLEIGGSISEQVLNFPDIVDKINGNEFEALRIEFAGLTDTGSQAYAIPSPAKRLRHILKTASLWPNLKSLDLHSISVGQEALDPINDFKHLNVFIIDKPEVTIQDLARQPFLKRLKVLQLGRIDSTNQLATTSILHSLADSNNLQVVRLIQSNVTAKDLLELRRCPQLYLLDLQEMNVDQLVPAITKMTSLRYVVLTKAPLKPGQIFSQAALTPGQIDSIIACPNIQRLHVTKELLSPEAIKRYGNSEPKVFLAD